MKNYKKVLILPLLASVLASCVLTNEDRNPCTVIFNANGGVVLNKYGEWVDTFTDTRYAGQYINFPNGRPRKANYIFKYWEGNGRVYRLDGRYPVEGNSEINAEWDDDVVFGTNSYHGIEINMKKRRLGELAITAFVDSYGNYAVSNFLRSNKLNELKDSNGNSTLYIENEKQTYTVGGYYHDYYSSEDVWYGARLDVYRTDRKLITYMVDGCVVHTELVDAYKNYTPSFADNADRYGTGCYTWATSDRGTTTTSEYITGHTTFYPSIDYYRGTKW